FLSPVKTLNVFCCGVGNIGGTLLSQIQSNQQFLEEKRQVKLNLAGICNSSKMLLNGEGISPDHWRTLLDTEAENATVQDFIDKAISENLPNSVFIDNTGSPDVASLYSRLFEHSISVVACNKIGVSGSYQQYTHNRDAALRNNADYWYETSVGAGLPIIKTIHELLISGDRIIKIEAILSGTISYIFNNYKGKRTFTEVVKEAQAKGFTEPNPRDDLSGLDFARKMLILARETGLKMELEDIKLQPILPQACLQAEGPEEFYMELGKAEKHFEALKKKAEAENLALHYVGILCDGKATIQLLMLDTKHPFYNLTGSDNIISLTTNRYLHNPMVIKGPGAGAEVTAAGVLSDLVRVAAK
ncbi:MAG: bifunctional aspartate kinase/homoserine dehydrogenase I, partial [Bacteroidales bacterium]|nr:bifunctional aspartate kinase/homoserine dehydrogenase I [Bacteroidales bacterium]